MGTGTTRRPRRPPPRGALRLGAGALLGLLAGPLAAAGPAPELTLAQALRRAEEVSEEIKIARSQAAAAATERRVARSFRLPILTAEIDYQRLFRTPFTLDGYAADIRLPYGRVNTWWGGFGLSQLVFDAGVARAQVRMADEGSTTARLRTLEAVSEVRLAVIEAFLDASLAAAELEASEATSRAIRAQLRLLAERSPSAATALDADRAAAEEEALEPPRVDARNRRDRSLGRLAGLLNLPPDPLPRLAEDPLATAPPPLDPAALDRILSAADRRPLLEAGTRNVTIREAGAKAAHAALFPTVNLTAHMGGWASPDETFPQRVDFRDDWGVAVNVFVNVFDWGRGRAKEAAAREEASQARLSLARLQQDLGVEVRQLRLELERASGLSGATTPARERAERVHDAVVAAYASGAAGHADLALARSTLRTARVSEARARHDARLALARLQRSAGISPDLTPPPPAAVVADGEEVLE